MRILPVVTATPEQLKILTENKPGVVLIAGSAGSGKTTTALMRIRQLTGSWLSRRQRLNIQGPVRVLVLTYNRTLEGYIQELAQQQVASNPDLQLEVRTFGKFARDLLDGPQILDPAQSRRIIGELSSGFRLDKVFISEEVDYVLGRFGPFNLNSYLTARRDGRGIAPRMEARARRQLLREVIEPYQEYKRSKNLMDWNDIAFAAGQVDSTQWDVVVVDEAQDFSATQIRAIMNHVAQDHSVTFVMDAAQRIYPRSFTWKEAGVSLTSIHRLKRNYRNTRQIAAFARSLVENMPLSGDGALPDFESASSSGPKPQVISGTYKQQVDYVLGNVIQSANLEEESYAFLKPLGGHWFDYLKSRLNKDGIEWVELTRASTWPGGQETVALCTLHSAKGLEFDHVIVLGLNQQVTPHGSEDGDSQLDGLRRLLAMGAGRARKTVTVGYKPGEASTLIGILDPGTYEEVIL